jgi:hypothetical protein
MRSSRGATVNWTGAPFRSTTTLSVAPLLVEMICAMCWKLLTVRPSIDLTISPGSKPAASAGLFSIAPPTRGTVVRTPFASARPAKITTASSRLASGPAAITNARCHVGLNCRWLGSWAAPAWSSVGTLAALVSPANLT